MTDDKRRESLENENETEDSAVKKNELKRKKPVSSGVYFFVEFIKVVVFALLVVVPIKLFIFQPFIVQGSSMEPNFHNREYLIVKEWGYKTTAIAAGNHKFFTVKSYKDIERGTVIVFRSPKNPDKFFIKRVIGLPNERVVISDGKITIFNDQNKEGFVLDESKYLPSGVKTGHPRSFDLGADEYVVLGDNRNNSSDSRYWGVLKKDLIIGKVVVRFWPFKMF